MNVARPLYHSHALLRDPDASDVAYRLVLGLQHINFDLPANSSLLNVWTTTSNTVIAAAQDVALGIEHETKPDPQQVWIFVSFFKIEFSFGFTRCTTWA